MIVRRRSWVMVAAISVLAHPGQSEFRQTCVRNGITELVRGNNLAATHSKFHASSVSTEDILGFLCSFFGSIHY